MISQNPAFRGKGQRDGKLSNNMNIGINVFIIRNGKLLLGKRKNASGEGDWGLPGGHLEPNEKFKDAAARELMEETGMVAKDFVFKNVVNQPNNSKHYVQIGFEAVGIIGEPELKELDRCEEWRWFEIKKLPPNIFFAHIEQIRNYIENKTFFE